MAIPIIIGPGISVGTGITIAAFPPLILSGLQLYLDAGDPASYPGTGTSWFDISGNSNTGTLLNAPPYTSGTSGYFTFDGVDDRVSFVNTNGFGTGGSAPAATMSFWANIQRRTGAGQLYQQIAGFRNDTSYNFFFLLLDTGGATVPTEARLGTPTGLAYDINVTFPYIGTWVNVAFVANINRTDLYFNGVLAGSNTNVAGTFGANSGQFSVGATPIGGFPTKGNISNVLFYNRALSAGEVLQNFNALRDRYGI